MIELFLITYIIGLVLGLKLVHLNQRMEFSYRRLVTIKEYLIGYGATMIPLFNILYAGMMLNDLIKEK